MPDIMPQKYGLQIRAPRGLTYKNRYLGAGSTHIFDTDEELMVAMQQLKNSTKVVRLTDNAKVPFDRIIEELKQRIRDKAAGKIRAPIEGSKSQFMGKWGDGTELPALIPLEQDASLVNLVAACEHYELAVPRGSTAASLTKQLNAYFDERETKFPDSMSTTEETETSGDEEELEELGEDEVDDSEPGDEDDEGEPKDEESGDAEGSGDSPSEGEASTED